MSRKYKFADKDALYFVTFGVVYWIDLFTRNEYRWILLESWKHCMRTKGLEIYGWCIMTSHVHMIVSSNKEPLDCIMRDMKRHASAKLREAIEKSSNESRKEWMLGLMNRAGQKNSNNVRFQLWQQDNHPIELAYPTMAHQKLDYFHSNPVDAGFVEKPEDYLYSSARSYHGMSGVLDILTLDPLIK
jgi:putative transposase